jgi:COP9 signalosome complex subunit 1
LGTDALRAAVKEAKDGRDVRRYLEAQGHMEVISPSDPAAKRDQEWVSTMSKKNQAETSRLEEELKGYKNNLIKESVRVCNLGTI